MRRVAWTRQKQLSTALFPQRERCLVVGERHAEVERYTYEEGWTAFVKGQPVTYHWRRCDAKRAVEVALTRRWAAERTTEIARQQ